jgi:hypothetical protein
MSVFTLLCAGLHIYINNVAVTVSRPNVDDVQEMLVTGIFLSALGCSFLE